MMVATCRRKTTSSRRRHDGGLLIPRSSSLMMVIFLLVTFHFIVIVVDGRSVVPVAVDMDEDGDDSVVKCFTKVPNVLGWVDSINDPPIIIDSNVPVSILRYNDNIYLDGGQPIFKEDIYIVVKKQGGSECNNEDEDDDDDGMVQIEYEQSPRVGIDWDMESYTNKITIHVVKDTETDDGGNGATWNDATTTTTEDEPDEDEVFLEPTTFFAQYSYTGFWCRGFQTVGPSSTPTPTMSPTDYPTLAPTIEDLTCMTTTIASSSSSSSTPIPTTSTEPTSHPRTKPPTGTGTATFTSPTQTPHRQGGGSGGGASFQTTTTTTKPPSSSSATFRNANNINNDENNNSSSAGSTTSSKRFLTGIITTIVAGLIGIICFASGSRDGGFLAGGSASTTISGSDTGDGNDDNIPTRGGGKRRSSLMAVATTIVLFLVVVTIGLTTLYADGKSGGSDMNKQAGGEGGSRIKSKSITSVHRQLSHSAGSDVGRKKNRKDGTTTRNLIQEGNGSKKCIVNVEILLDGCRRPTWIPPNSDVKPDPDLLVTAPAVRVLDVNLDETLRYEDPNDVCTTHYEATLTFPIVPEEETEPPTMDDNDNEIDGDNPDKVDFPKPPPSIQPLAATTRSTSSEPVEVPSLSDVCGRAIEGRPFVDANGKRVQADARTLVDDHSAISQDGPQAKKKHKNSGQGWSSSPNEGLALYDRDVALGKLWTERALGEHASVPAFAAFTIALMSNNAPPSLIEDALTAAMDEVRHAKTSFEVASILLGETVEPGPLPPSKLEFGSNITALALAAAQEGCIDETLSALTAAYEVESHIDKIERLSPDTKSMLKDKIRTIAMEESRHSALAWRTVKWACRVDPNACSSVEENILRPDRLDRAFQERFTPFGGKSGMLASARKAWEKVYKTLIPFALSEKPHLETTSCDHFGASRELLHDTPSSESTFLDRMANSIIGNAICGRESI